MKNEKQLEKLKIFFALGVTVVFFLFFIIITDPFYETNDDMSVAFRAGTEGQNYIPFINHYLCNFIYVIQHAFFGRFNAFIILQIAINFCALAAIVCLLLDENGSDAGNLMVIAMAFLLGYDCFEAVQFTKTAAMACIAGGLLYLYALKDKNRGRNAAIAGSAFIIIGSLLRKSIVTAVVPIIGIGVLFLGIRFYSRNLFTGDSLLDAAKRKKGIIAAFAATLSIVSVIGSLSYAANTSTPELEEYQKYNSARAKVVDYPIPKYDDNAAFYEELGMGRNDLVALSKWYLDTDGIGAYDNLKAVGDLAEEEKPGMAASFMTLLRQVGESFKQMDFRALRLLFLVLLVALAPWREKRYYVRIGVAMLILTGAGIFYLAMKGRVVYRATFGLEAMAICCFMYLLRDNVLNHTDEKKRSTAHRKEKMITLGIATVLILFNAFRLQPWFKPEYDTKALYNYFNENSECLFITDQAVSTNYYDLYYYRNPLIQPAPCPNTIGFGGWSTGSPYNKSKMAEYGVSNLYGDIIDNDNVYVVCLPVEGYEGTFNRTLSTYFNEHYAPEGGSIVFEKVNIVGGYSIWQATTRY
jgi:hypothetical protein